MARRGEFAPRAAAVRNGTPAREPAERLDGLSVKQLRHWTGAFRYAALNIVARHSSGGVYRLEYAARESPMGARHHAIQQVLVVADDLSLAMTLRQRLVAPGRKTCCVVRAADARALPSCYDVAVLDPRLEDGCGVELAQELLASGTIGAAVFFTDVSAPRVLELARTVGECVSKSEGVDRVVSHVKERLAATHAADAVDDDSPPSSGKYATTRASGRRSYRF